LIRLFGFVGAALGGQLGWWLGSQVDFMTGFLLSTVGTGVGLYIGRRLLEAFLD